jgi:hypothetical protein
MDGYDEKRLNEDAFGAKGTIVSAFDAFRRTTADLNRETAADRHQLRANLSMSRAHPTAANGPSP